MGRITATKTIAAAPDAVWDVMTDPSRYGEWLTVHTKWKNDEAPPRFTQGAQAEEVVTMLGMPNTITWTVDEFVEASKLRISGTGMAGVKTAFEMKIAPDGDGTTASIDAEFEGQMIAGALGKAIEQDAQRNLDESLDNVAGLVA